MNYVTLCICGGSESVSHAVIFNSEAAWTVAHQAIHGILQARILGWVAILQGTCPIQELNPGLLHCRQILY